MEGKICINYSLYNPSYYNNMIVNKKTIKGEDYYKVWIYLSGNYLPFIEYVEYKINNKYYKVKYTIDNQQCRFAFYIKDFKFPSIAVRLCYTNTTPIVQFAEKSILKTQLTNPKNKFIYESICSNC